MRWPCMFRSPIDASTIPQPTLLNGRGFALRDAVGQHIGAISPTDTTALWSNLSRFPPGVEPLTGGYYQSGDWFWYAKIGDEVVIVTSQKPIDPALPVSIVRGQLGTTAAAHANGAGVTLLPYYRRFNPYPVKSYAPLDLPVI